MTVDLGTPLTLPCGATLPNRIAKAAMTERLADSRNRPTMAHERLYRRWARGGAGLLLTGNVIISRDGLEAPGNVVVDGQMDDEARAAFGRMAAAATSEVNQAWVQLSHAGRQTPAVVNPQPKAPSAVPVALPGNQFGKPVALTDDEIEGLVEAFAAGARRCIEHGFTGVQVHGAHGYLISQFLNPRVNQRSDRWGGDLDGRARFLVAVVRAVRAAVGAAVPVSVKLNSSDFQQGGFSFAECKAVVEMLGDEGLDLLEISGGSYEQPAMMDLEGMEPAVVDAVQAAAAAPQQASTRAREAYFVDYAEAVREVARMPLMLTGGLRTKAAMEDALARGIDVVGLGRPLCTDPDLPRQLIAGQRDAARRWEHELNLGPAWASGFLGQQSPLKLVRALNGFSVMSWFYEQIRLLSEGNEPDTARGILGTFLRQQSRDRAQAAALER